MSLTFVEAFDTYSVYTDRDGEEVLIGAGPGFRRVVEMADLDIADVWDRFTSDHGYYGVKERFLEHLRLLVTDPADADDIAFCDGCQRPSWSDDLNDAGDDARVCEPCWDDWWTCSDCGGRFPETSTTLHDEEVCESCRDRHYNWCEDCEGYYHHDYASDHRHGGCDCESPAMHFRVRNDGQDPLDNDTRTTITLPAGMISDEGMRAISRYLRDKSREFDAPTSEHLWSLSYGLDEKIGTRWQAKDGNFTKRLSRHAYQTYGLKITPEILSQIGNIASDHSRAIDFAIETTRNLNMSAEDFYHEDSCWWQSYSESRCALKTNGGFGLRTFGDYDTVKGRAWVMPMRLDDTRGLVPTFETQEPDAFVVFNGYGDLSGYSAARIVAHMAGMTYRKINFACSPMYVNGDSGYIVAPEEIAEDFTDGSLSLSVDQHSHLYHSEKGLANVA